MAASPIFPVVPNVGITIITAAAANTAKDGTGTVFTAFTAGASGAVVDMIRFKPTGSIATATVARIFINNGLTNATAGNNSYWDDVQIPIVTLSEVAPMVALDLALGLQIPAGYKINVVLSTASASAVAVTCLGRNY